MSAVELGVIVKSLFSLIVFVIVIFRFWPAQREDMFRQQMFAIRDELFDFAMDDNIDFEHPAYILLRQLMNGFIRYAHNLTPFRTILSFLRWKYAMGAPPERWTEAWGTALNSISDESTRIKLQEFHSRATDLVLGQLLLSPGVLILAIVFVLPVIVLHTQWTNLRSIYQDVTGKIPMSFLEEEAANS
jgi:hypothetical protein